jgi:hypothetical protein
LFRIQTHTHCGRLVLRPALLVLCIRFEGSYGDCPSLCVKLCVPPR